MINSQDIKKGTAIRMDGGIWVCIDFQHRKPGKGNTIMIIKVKNVSDGRVLEISERNWKMLSSSAVLTSISMRTSLVASS